MTKANSKLSGFTIVELLVVIVVIGVLATITVVSYTGISQKAIAASLQSDLNGASKKLNMYYIENGYYPTSISDCPTPIASNVCLQSTSGNIYTDYLVDNSSNPKTFSLPLTHDNLAYFITNSTSPAIYISPWVTIGTQSWSKTSLDAGTRIDSSTSQTNNSIVEKYCYNNLDSNCAIYGGLYTWDEVMQYTTTQGTKGICYSGSHVPTDAEWTTLVTYLGGTSVAGGALKESGLIHWTSPNTGATNSSGFGSLGTGYRNGASFGSLGGLNDNWTSSRDGSNNPYFYLINNSSASASRNFNTLLAFAFSVRCIKN